MFVNGNDDLFTYIPYLVPVNLSIPFFNVMNAYGSALITRIQTGQTVNITLPRLAYDSSCEASSLTCVPAGPEVLPSLKLVVLKSYKSEISATASY